MRQRLGAIACGCAAALVWLAILAADLRITDEPGRLAGRWNVLRAVMLWWALLVPAVLLLRRAPRRLGVALVLAGLVGLQVAGMQRPTAVLSDDAYRYAFEGRVQAAGVDPYRYAPTAPELARFRDPWLFPDPAGCAAIGREPGCTRINYKDERTIYPPVAEAWFAVVHALPGPHRDGKLQLYAGLAGLALTLLLMRELALRGRSPAEAAWYAWSPMAGLDVASDAHVDVLAALLAVVALALARQRRPGATGVAIGAAIAVKLYPALLLPALLRTRRPARLVDGRGRRRRRVVRTAPPGGGSRRRRLPAALSLGRGLRGGLPVPAAAPGPRADEGLRRARARRARAGRLARSDRRDGTGRRGATRRDARADLVRTAARGDRDPRGPAAVAGGRGGGLSALQRRTGGGEAARRGGLVRHRRGDRAGPALPALVRA